MIYPAYIKMCWNAAVSLNTFLFSSFVLVLIYYNNTYTQYKIKEFNNVWLYVFFASFILIQLAEFFIWRNLQDKFYNNIFSTLAMLLLICQPLASLMLLNDHAIRNTLLSVYLLMAVPFTLYNLATKNIQYKKSKNGHLYWDIVDSSFVHINWLIWLFFGAFSFVYEQNLLGGFIFMLVTLAIMCYNYMNDETIGTMWCWAINGLMIYYAAYLLFYLPFCEKKQIC